MEESIDGLPLASQACNECRRRKARCDRILPQCRVCGKFRRHCLYEKHSKTPLTRLHLTDVEARLERAENLLKSYRRRDALLAKENAKRTEARESSASQSCQGIASSVVQAKIGHGGLNPMHDSVAYLGRPYDEDNTDSLLPEPISEDFNWDEQFRPMAFGDARSYKERVADSLDPIRDVEDGVALDGMANLTLNEDQLGFLGSTAGAPFLRLLWRPSDHKLSNSLKPSNDHQGDSSIDAACFASIPPSIDSHKLVADSFVDSYFTLFHTSYPLIHEPSFRAVYSEIIPCPEETSWTALVNIVAAIGAFTSMMKCKSIDTPFYFAAKAALSLDNLEMGNVTLIQALILMATYLSRRNKPNTGYIFAGLAKQMAFGLGLHKEPKGKGLSLLKQETRRRLWWSVYILDSSMSVTLSRPLTWINSSIDVALPLNVSDSKLTPQTKVKPPPEHSWTIYSGLRAQANFYTACQHLYNMLNAPTRPSPEMLIDLDDRELGGWLKDFSSLLSDDPEHTVSDRFALVQSITKWKVYNFRMIMYRSFLLQSTLHLDSKDSAIKVAQERCLDAAHKCIASVSEYWKIRPRTRMAAWYALYFIFQAVLVPITCLRKYPKSSKADFWRRDIRTTLDVVEEIHFIHGSKCAAVIHDIADAYLQHSSPVFDDSEELKIPDTIHNSKSAEIFGETYKTPNFDFDAVMQNLDSMQPQDAWDIMWPGILTQGHNLDMDQNSWMCDPLLTDDSTRDDDFNTTFHNGML